MQINLEIDQLPIAFRIQIKLSLSAAFHVMKAEKRGGKLSKAIGADFIAGTKE
jgi:hypothetical protein